MSYPTVFHLISTLSKKDNVSCVLIGGFAVNYYKLTRQTVDVDFLITESDFEKIEVALKKEGFRKDCIQQGVFIRLKSNKSYLIDLDFMFVDRDTLDKIIKDGKEINIAGQRFIVPSLFHLIALKLHSIKYNPKLREPKDFPDIIGLIRANNIKVKDKEFKELCLKYGTEEIYHEILNYI